MNQNTKFTPEEWLRYTRHIQLPQVGAQGQSKLKDSHVLIIGSGGLGSPVSLYLAAAGVGTITLVDHDTVDVTNLQRQILFNSNDVGKGKSISGAQHLKLLNPHLDIQHLAEALTPENAASLIAPADLVLDCTDNFATRYLINDTCHFLNTPWIYASIHQFSGQCSLFSEKTGCFRCLFPEYPENIDDCNSAGVLGVLPGLLGTLQANEALKFLCGLNTPLEGKLLLADAIQLDFQKIQLGKSPECQCCGKHADKNKTALQKDYNLRSCTQSTEENKLDIPSNEFSTRLHDKDYQIVDVRTDAERNAFHLGGMHIPLDTLNTQAETTLNKQKKILCYCQSGVRSHKAAKHLLALGFSAQSIQGGITNIIKSSE